MFCFRRILWSILIWSFLSLTCTPRSEACFRAETTRRGTSLECSTEEPPTTSQANTDTKTQDLGDDIWTLFYSTKFCKSSYSMLENYNYRYILFRITAAFACNVTYTVIFSMYSCSFQIIMFLLWCDKYLNYFFVISIISGFTRVKLRFIFKLYYCKSTFPSTYR